MKKLQDVILVYLLMVAIAVPAVFFSVNLIMWAYASSPFITAASGAAMIVCSIVHAWFARCVLDAM